MSCFLLSHEYFIGLVFGKASLTSSAEVSYSKRSFSPSIVILPHIMDLSSPCSTMFQSPLHAHLQSLEMIESNSSYKAMHSFTSVDAYTFMIERSPLDVPWSLIHCAQLHLDCHKVAMRCANCGTTLMHTLPLLALTSFTLCS